MTVTPPVSDNIRNDQTIANRSLTIADLYYTFCLYVYFMMPWIRLPHVQRCCFCIPDLRTAVYIIASLGIVTSPALSWAVVRHAYMIRVSCMISASDQRPDVVDVNLKNILSFGFGANSGIGTSCLGPHAVDSTASMVIAVKYLGWVALVFDVAFLFSSIYLLICLSRAEHKRPLRIFMISVAISIVISFIYAMLYVSACLQIGGSFPIFEFLFAFVDIGLVGMWIYFLIVLRSYILGDKTQPSYFSYEYFSFAFWRSMFGDFFTSIYERISRILPSK